MIVSATWMLLFAEFMARVLDDAFRADMELTVLTEELERDLGVRLAHLEFFANLTQEVNKSVRTSYYL